MPCQSTPVAVQQVALDWYDGHQKVDLSDYVNSGTWDILGCPGIYSYDLDPAEGHHKAQITFTLRMRRKTLFYTVNLIIPCVLISFLSVCVFYLPADAGEKTTMCISILLSLIVFLLLVSKILPPTSVTIPLISRYLLFTFIMNIVSIVSTMVIISWNFRTPLTHRMPRWVCTIFLHYLPRLLAMRRPRCYCRRHRPFGGHRSSEPSSTATMGRLLQLPAFAGSRRVDISAELAECGCSYRRLPHLPANMSATGESVRWQSLRRACCREDAETAAGTRSRTGTEQRSFGQTQRPEVIASCLGNALDDDVVSHDVRRALDAVNFVAAHLRNEDDYAEVSFSI